MIAIAKRSSGGARKAARIVFQAALVIVVAAVFYGAFVNAADHLARANISSGFRFWNNTAGFDISQTLIPYSASTSTFGRAFWVGLLNTLLVAAIALVLATAVGFVIGIARLSRNWLVARLAGAYVEVIRNVPLLLQLFFWYNAVLKSLPALRGSVALPGGGILNNRGLYLPRPDFAPQFGYVLAALALRAYALRRHDRTGSEVPLLWPTLALIIILPAAVFALTGFPLGFSVPHMGRFNVSGGIEILPEFAALVLALSV